MILIGEYEDGTRTARVYKRESCDFYIEMRDDYYNYDGFHVIMNEENAKEFAEVWVLLH